MALTDMLNTEWVLKVTDKATAPFAAIKRGADSAERSLDGLDKKTNTFSNRLKSQFSGFGATALAGAGGFLAGMATSAFSAITTGALAEAADADKALGQIQAGLLSTKGISGQTVDGLLADAKRFRNESLFGDDEVVQKLQAQLLTFTNITGTNFKRTEQAAIDLATRLGGDLQGSAIMLGKAINDPIQGLSALRRVGVAFTEDQQKMIATLVKQNDLFGAQKIILDSIEQQYGGSAKAAADGMAGALHRQTEAVNDLKEAWGNLLFRSGIVEGATKFFSNLNFIFSDTKGQQAAVIDKFSAQFEQMFKGGYTPADFKKGQAPGIRYADSGMTLTAGQLDAYRTYFNQQQYPMGRQAQTGFAASFGGGRAMLAQNAFNGPFLPGQSYTPPAGAATQGTSLQALQDQLKDLNEAWALDTSPLGSSSRKTLLADIADVQAQIKKFESPLDALNKTMSKELGGINSKVVTSQTPRIVTVNIDKLVEQFTVNSIDTDLNAAQIRGVIEKALIDSVRDVEQGLGANG